MRYVSLTLCALAFVLRADALSLDLVDPMIGTEGLGTEYGGMTPMTGVPFGSMHLIPVTRTNGNAATSFNALDKNLLGFILSRQPAIWMGEWGALRIWLKEPLPIESVKASPCWTRVVAGGRTYELTASSHAAFIRTDDPQLAADVPDEGFTTERSQRTSIRPLPNFRSWHVKRRTGNVVRFGVSLIDAATARRNLETELPADFDRAVAVVRQAWRRFFDRVDLDAPDEVRTIFATGLYHCLLYPRDITENGRYYSGIDDRVHEGVGHTCYSLWDTHRSEHAALTLFAPDRVDGMMQSLVSIYREGGWLPLHPNPGYTTQMIGGPAEVVLAEAYVKGFRGFDVAGAWEAVWHNAMVPPDQDESFRWAITFDDRPGPIEARGGLTRYKEIGYVACDETDESVSRTLDYAFDDDAVASFAAALGKHREAALLRARAKNYTNLWCAAVRRFMPRDRAGRWVRPKTFPWDHYPFTETDEDTARWCVPHDVAGLAELMGGRDVFVRELDRFFETGFFVRDTVGNVSVHGNETAHHLAYMYNRVGEYDRTCRRVRDILTRCYSSGRKGFDGNEDCGQMSSWYLLSALGFYPLSPASGWYELGSPIVKGAVLRFGKPYPAAELRVTVRGYAPDRWRVRRVTLNGRELSDRRVRHADLVKGGELVFEMQEDGE